MNMSDSVGLEKLQFGSLREQVYEEIKKLILLNRLRPGQDVVIDQIANELGISHTPIREALAKLELDGLVTMHHHRTPRIAEINIDDVREVYEMRIVLEGWAAPQAALTLTEAQLSQAKKLLETAKLDAEQSKYDTHLMADIFFHEMIAQSTGNSLFLRLYEMISNQSVRIRSLVEAQSAGHIDVIINEHFSIFDALVSRDPDLAQQRLVAHLESAKQRTLEALKNIEEESDKDIT